MVYSCPRCGYLTSRRTDIEKHIFKRKGLCPPLVSNIQRTEMAFLYNKQLQDIEGKRVHEQDHYVCYFCPKAFGSRAGRLKHLQTLHRVEYEDINQHECFHQSAHTITNNTGPVTIVEGSNNSINTFITNNNTNIHIHLNPFGKENTSFITDDLRRKCLINGNMGLQAMLFDIYFNKDHPENHNVKLQSLRNQHVFIYTIDETWIRKHLDDAVLTMVQTSQIEIKKVPCSDPHSDPPMLHTIECLTPAERSNTKKKVLAALADRRDKNVV